MHRILDIFIMFYTRKRGSEYKLRSHIYIDCNRGDDSNADGSLFRPFRTFNAAFTAIDVLLHVDAVLAPGAYNI